MREPTKNDYTQDELDNLKNGLCWCGKPKKEFEKGMRGYCCKDHREDWYVRTAYWGTIRDMFLKKNGEKCKECGVDNQQLKDNLVQRQKDWKKKILADPRSKVTLDEQRIRLLKKIETDYENAMNDDYLFEDVFDVYMSVDGFPQKPDRRHSIDFHFEVDHIKAVALGGDQWDEKNFQVLCSDCHKKKTALDMKILKAKRRKLVRFEVD